MPLELPCNPPSAWNVTSLEEAEKARQEEEAHPRKTWMEVHASYNPEVHRLTGRKNATALIWSTVPDGQKRLVGMLGRQDVAALMEVFDL